LVEKPHNKTVYFQNIDGLRFIAALSVTMFHCFKILPAYFSYGENLIFNVLNFIFSQGELGVNFFFVLSGFLISYLSIYEINKNGSFNAMNFIIRRCLRIWPLFYLVTLFGFFIGPIIFGYEINSNIYMYCLFLANFEYMFNGFPGAQFLTVHWSVSIEEQYYISWAILLFCIRLSQKHLFLTFFLFIILISTIFRLIYPSSHLHTLSVISDIGIGGVLATLSFYNNAFLVLLKNLKKSTIIILYIIGFLFIYFPDIFLIDFYAFRRTALGLFWGFIIVEQTFCQNSLYKISNIPFLSFLGNLTYGTYMYHSIIILIINSIWIKYGIFSKSIYIFYLQTFIILFLTLIVSIISYRYFEKPFLNLKEKFRNFS
jgi:peptidoglycan/LPS O-acetylase OafA/YrhL